MSDTVIKVDGLSKAYQIGAKERHGKTFREAFVETFARPFRRMYQPAGGANGDGGEEETFWALKDVSFDVKRGEVLGIIGRNGAGKSTLLKVLSRITEPTSGSVRLRGRVASLLEVGTGFHPELTGRENIYLNGAVLGMKRAEITRKFDEIVAFAEVEKFLDTPVKRYSSGMYVRLAFAVAAHLEPEILIVDEVLAVGDAEFQKKCLGKMQDVAKGEGRTVLFVSHNMAAVEMMCNRGVVLQAGQLAYHGACDKAVANYQSRAMSASTGQSGSDFEFHSVSCVPSSGGALRTFEPCRFEVRFRPFCAGLVAAHLFIEDQYGSLVSGLDTRDFVSNVRAEKGQIVRCVVDVNKLPLNGGTYRVRVLLRNDSEFRTWEVPATFEMEVQESGVYGVRQTEHRWHGTTAMAARVEVHAGCAVTAEAKGQCG